VPLVFEGTRSCFWMSVVQSLTNKHFWVPSNISASSAFFHELVCFVYAKPNDVMGFKCFITSFCCFRFLAPLGYCLVIVTLKSRAVGCSQSYEFNSGTRAS